MESQAPDLEAPKKVPTSGVFIQKGMRVSIPPGGFTVSLGLDGKPSVTASLHVVLDMVPIWLGIAIQHLSVSEAAAMQLSGEWQNQDNDRISSTLEADSNAAMQASMASAIALDAFYAAVKQRIRIPKHVEDAWRRKRTARHKCVFEVCRQAFVIRAEGLKPVRAAIKEIYRFRDLAVHPNPSAAEPLLHPTLGVGTEWRFVYYRFDNARNLVAAALSLVVQFLQHPKPKHKLEPFCEEASAALAPLVLDWEAKYGLLYIRRNGGKQ